MDLPPGTYFIEVNVYIINRLRVAESTPIGYGGAPEQRTSARYEGGYRVEIG